MRVTEEQWFTDWEFGGTTYANRALYEQWSPLNFVGNWKTPMLIVHSQLDYRVDLSEGYQAFTAAKRMGVDAKFLYFPDEGHWVLRRGIAASGGARSSTGWRCT